MFGRYGSIVPYHRHVLGNPCVVYAGIVARAKVAARVRFQVAESNMRKLACTLAVLTMVCELFAWWGLHTTAGTRHFDEMAGIIPLAAGALGAVLACGALGAWWLSRPRARH
jgi:hypothetical protein